MRALVVILGLLLLVGLASGCLNKAQDNIPETTSAASTVLRLSNQTSINQSEYAAFTCQLNMTRGAGLDGKEIHWFIDNVAKDSSFTQWGYANLNLTSAETQDLSIGKHVLKASFDGDLDYSPSNATSVFQVRAAPSPTPTPSASPTPTAEPEPHSITLNAVRPGSTSVSGTFSGKNNDENIYVFTRLQGDKNWTVQSALPYLNGTFSADLSLAGHGSYDVLAMITSSHVSTGDSVSALPKSAAESPRITLTVK